MTAGRKPPTPPPGLSGLSDDWERYRNLRRDGENPQTTEAPPADGDATTPRRHDTADEDQAQDATPPKRPRRRAAPLGRRSAPRAAEAVALTVRFAEQESTELDHFMLLLRTGAGRRHLDKAEVVRELLRLARDHEPTRKALLRRLKD